jgi:1,4-alpha-glucan branching enzyme
LARAQAPADFVSYLSIIPQGLCSFFVEEARRQEMIKKELAAGTEQVQVTFTVPSTTWADRVNLVGEFNDWDATATPMFQTRTDENWQVTIGLTPGQRYRFRYLLDGQDWLNDWKADGYSWERLPGGLCDSVVDLTQVDPALLSLS